MATQVEVGGPLASALRNLGEQRRSGGGGGGATLQPAFLASLTEPARQPPREPPEEGPACGATARAAGMPPAASRARLTPRPFCRGQSSDSFAVVKPPGPSPRPGPLAPAASAGSVPPLMEHRAAQSGSPPGDAPGTTVAFWPGPPANTVILFDSGQVKGGRAKGPPEQAPGSGQAPGGSRRRLEGAATVHRQLSLSSEPRAALAWSPRRPVERKETFSGVPEEELRAKGAPRPDGGPANAKPRLRPLSAFFLEPPKDLPPAGPLEGSREPPQPEKPSWARKPRPLSMDLTARFEHRELSLQGKPTLADHAAAGTLAGTPLGLEGPPRPAAADSCFPSGAKAVPETTDGKTLQKLPPSEAAPQRGQSPPKDPWKGRTGLWEQRLRVREGPAERETVTAAPPEKGKETPGRKGDPQPEGGWAASNRAGSGERPAEVSEPGSQSGALQRPPPGPEAPRQSSERGDRAVSIQQRIRELNAENPEAKAGSLSRSFRSRPLSADLTKPFSSPAAGGDAQTERQPESSRKTARETEATAEEEAHLPWEAGSGGPGGPWKPQQMLRTAARAGGPPERGGGRPKEQQRGPPADTSHEADTPPAGSATIQTVRATLFEHTVQRLSVVAAHPRPDPAPQPVSEPARGQPGGAQGPGLENAPGAGEITGMGPCRPGDRVAVPEHRKKARPPSGDSAPEWGVRGVPYEERTEESLVCRRIEPRYEVLQTVGERVRSEAVAVAVLGDKALTLRSSKAPWKEGQRRAGGPAWPQSPEAGRDSRKEGGWAATKPSRAAEAAAETSSPKDLPAPHGPAAEKSGRRTEGPQTSAEVLPFPGGGRSAVAAHHRGMRPSSESDEGQSEALLAGQTEGPGRRRLPHQSPGAGPGDREDPRGRAAGARQGLQSFPAGSERGDGTPLHRTAMGQRPANADPPGAHEGREPRGVGPGDPRAADVAQGLCISDPVGEGRPRRSAHPQASPRALDRWRRKTLPHGAASFEELAREAAVPLARRDSLQVQEGSLARRSPGARPGADPKEGRLASPSRPGPGAKGPLSPAEAKATYFALTCHRPGENGEALEPLGGEPEEAPPARGPRRSHPADPPPGTGLWDAQAGPRDRPLGRSGGGSGPTELSGRGVSSARPPARTRAEGPEESVAAVGPRPASLPRPHQPDGRPAGPTGQSHGASKAPPVGSYQSRILDLDLLMAEYQEGSRKAFPAPAESEGARDQEAGRLPWEPRPAAPWTPAQRGAWRTAPKPERSPAEPFPLEEGEKGRGIHSQRASPAKAGEDTSSAPPPVWGRPGAEVPKGPPSEQRRAPAKKTFLLDEEPLEGARRWRPGGRGADRCPPEPSPAGVVAEPWARPPSSPPPPASAGGPSLKGAEEGCPRSLHAGSKWRAGRSPEKDPPVARSGAEARAVAAALGDWRGPSSSSEKPSQARAKGTLSFGPLAGEWQPGWGRIGAQGSPAQSSPSQPSRRSSSPGRPLLHRGNKETGDGRNETGQDGSGARGSPSLPLQRRSRSFYSERRTGHGTADQLKQCFGRPSTGAKDTDTLVQEAESHYGTWSDHRLSGDSFAPESPSSEGNLTPARRPLAGSRPSSFSSQTEPTSTPEPQDSSREPRSASPEGSSTDADSSAEGPRVPAPVAGASLDFSFLEQTAVLDSSALKARVQLSKRRHQARAPISRALRRGSPQEAGQPPQPPQHLGPGGAETAWMIQDSAGEASAPREACEEGEAPPPSERPPFPQGPPRLPVFPRVDHSALKAQLRKRHEPEGTGGAPSAQPPRSPKSPFHAGLSGGRALPPGTEKEERVTPPPSPQWLKELRSKKRHSQYENQV